MWLQVPEVVVAYCVVEMVYLCSALLGMPEEIVEDGSDWRGRDVLEGGCVFTSTLSLYIVTAYGSLRLFPNLSAKRDHNVIV